jgi:hypothetical protein
VLVGKFVGMLSSPLLEQLTGKKKRGKETHNELQNNTPQ